MLGNYHINEAGRKEIAAALSKALASSYTLYLKTHNYHWNVKGPLFHSLHTLFEQQYTDLAVAVDDLAERIRTLDFPAPGSYAAFAKLSDIKEDESHPPAAEMAKTLASDNLLVTNSLREVVQVAEKHGDDASADLANERIAIHEKNAWMLRSMVA